MKKIITLLLLLIPVQKISAQSTSVLFIGNSYTYVNDLPATVRQLALSKGDSMFTDMSAISGYTFQMHSANPTTQSKISQQPWDYVVLQEQSQIPAFSQSQVQTEVYPFATIIDSLIHANDSCTETVFFMTWGRKNGDASNCASYPPICTYEGMQQGLRESYLNMGQMNHATVSPVGMAWKKIIADSLSFNLFQADESHPSVYGTYLTACVFYAMIFQKSPIGATYYSTIPDTTALLLQQTADAIVFDSLSVWFESGNIPFAGFDFSAAGTNVTFQSTDLNGVQFQWDLGDGNSSTQQNPSHNYVPGTYTVTQIVTGHCMSDTVTHTLTVLSSGIIESNIPSYEKIYYADGWIYFRAEISTSIILFDMVGRKVFEQSIEKNKSIQSVNCKLSSGCYIAVMQTNEIKNLIVKLIIP
ncbi:MAG: PKD domain-containing protein [Sphingobacteriales bacterium]|nr:MAG: PKD domain-containing protein [Sphingobacteriales bacterium]